MKSSIIITLICLVSLDVFSQNNDDVLLLNSKCTTKKNDVRYRHYINFETSTKSIYTSLFFFYKTLISSQDGSRCSFHPSCSEYGLLCVEKYGIFEGILKTSDRLSRCNGLSPENYDLIEGKNLLHDPPY
tara:strand:- start:62 stop:451 length:390 start_codon:yes stop_codon:yes gene_type:complete